MESLSKCIESIVNGMSEPKGNIVQIVAYMEKPNSSSRQISISDGIHVYHFCALSLDVEGLKNLDIIKILKGKVTELRRSRVLQIFDVEKISDTESSVLGDPVTLVALRGNTIDRINIMKFT